MSIDIFNPPISKVSKDMAGKTFLIYGTNRTGKTKQATRFDKPVYLAFEAGLNGIAGVPFFPMKNWSDFVEFIKAITPNNKDTLAKVHEMYQTIIVDEASIIGQLCSDYVCETKGADTLASGNNGFGLWKEYSQTFETQLRKLTLAGFTVVFIAHEGTRKFFDEKGQPYEKIYPAGDKRIIDPICNAVDFIIYLGVNGVDPETGKEVYSSAYLTNTREYHAGSRFDYCTPYIPVFTAENLKAAITDAVAAEENASGINAVTYEEQKKLNNPDVKEPTYDELVESIRKIAMKMTEDGKKSQYMAVVEQHLGKDKGVMDTTPAQTQVLKLILMDLQDFAA